MAQKLTVTIVNKAGLHARPSAMFVQTASRYLSQITVTKDDREVDGKSIMGLLTLTAKQGSELVIAAEGSDENEAAQALVKLVEGGFGDEVTQ